MKKIFGTIICIFMFGMGTIVQAQFIQSHYYEGNSSLTSDYVAGGVAVDTNNNKWFGTDQGVTKFDGATWTKYTLADGLPSLIISCIAVDKNNNVWIGTDGDGVAKFNGSAWTTYTSHSTNNGIDSLCDNGIRYIAGDINGDIWFASAGSGVSKLSGSTWTTYRSGLPMDGGSIAGVNFITVDALGNKWFGTSMGISKYDGSTFTNIDQASVDSLLDNNIFSIAIDASNNKWIGTQNGMTELNSSNGWVKNYRKSNGLYNNAVQDIEIDAQGKLWLGCYTDYNNDGGISRLAGTTWVSEQIDYPDSVSADQIFRLAVDKNNDIWVAIDYGVIRIDHTSGISEKYESGNLCVYPNPASDQLTVRFDNANGNKIQTIELYSTIQKVKEISVPENSSVVTIPLNDLTNGLYFVKFGNITKKITISR